MEEFFKSVNEVLDFRRYNVLPDNNNGSVTSRDARDKASREYEIFNKTQRIDSDFDKFTKRIKDI